MIVPQLIDQEEYNKIVKSCSKFLYRRQGVIQQYGYRGADDVAHELLKKFVKVSRKVK